MKEFFLLLYGLAFVQGYTLLNIFHEDYPGKCALRGITLHPPLPQLDVKSIEPGEVLGIIYDENKSYCNRLSCSLWKNHKGEGYRLENLGCNVVTKRPNNCTKYTKEDNRLPWPECCYHKICPRIRDEL